MVAEEDYSILEAFVRESLEMVQRATPFVRALVEQPDREDILPQTTDLCFRLFHSIKGTGAFLNLDQLVAPAEAMEYLLDQIRSGVFSFSPRHIALLAETCRFMEQGLPLVLAEKNDERLTASAAALSEAILQSLATSAGDDRAGMTIDPIPERMHGDLVLETENLLASAEQEFVLWDFIAVDHQRVEELCRVLHRLRQNFSLYDFRDLERLCRALESTLNRYLQGEFFQTEYPERVFLRSIDAIRETMTQFSATDDLAVAGLEHHLAAIQGLMRQPIGELLVEAGLVDTRTVDAALAVQRSATVEKPLRLGEVLVAMGEVTEEQVQHVLQEQHNNRARAEQAETVLNESGPDSLAASDASLACHEVGVDGRKLARMIALITELGASQPPDGQGPLLRELQELARSCNRDVLAALATRFQRVVHDLAVQHNKRVHFVIEGMDVLQELGNVTIVADSLLHLLRNGVEHGLESVEERVRLGKRKSGRLTLLALQQGEEIWVSVEDDGQGLDLEILAGSGIERHRTPANNVDPLTGSEPVPTTAQAHAGAAADRQSGSDRRTGLSSVNKYLQELRGKIAVSSRPGKGTRVTLRVPRPLPTP